MDKAYTRKRAAIVFSGGALRGFSQFGAYREIKQFLDKKSADIDLVVGTSFGSISASLIALGYGPEKMEEIARKSGLKLANMMDFKLKGSGLLSGNYLKSRLDRYIDDKTLKDTYKELKISTVDIRSGIEYLFTRRGIEACDGSDIVEDTSIKIIDAIRASTAIPALFVPVHMHGRMWVDGGLVNAIALHSVNMKEYDFVVAVDVCMGNFDFVTNNKPNKIEMIAQSVSIAQRQFAFSRMERYMKENPNLIMIKPDVGPVKINRKDEMERILRCGRDEARKVLENL